MEPKNVDDILVQVMQEQNTGVVEPSVNQYEIPQSDDNQESQGHENDDVLSEKDGQNIDSNNIKLDETSNESSDSDNVLRETVDKKNTKTSKEDSDSPIDEYGNPIAKSKTYTEEEVNQMIRDRLSRGRHADNPPLAPNQVQKVKQAAEDFEADPNSGESWETQLKNYVRQTLNEVTQEQAESQWRQQEAARQAEFESKFTTGMKKYGDFHQVVADKPITDSMMLATRSLENPAAFIYGASKMHPGEIERISRISDPYVQASEIGRLHERMVKERKVVSAAPKPVAAPKGDVTQKVINQVSIDQRIHQHAQRRFGKK